MNSGRNTYPCTWSQLLTQSKKHPAAPKQKPGSGREYLEWNEVPQQWRSALELMGVKKGWERVILKPCELRWHEPKPSSWHQTHVRLLSVAEPPLGCLCSGTSEALAGWKTLHLKTSTRLSSGVRFKPRPPHCWEERKDREAFLQLSLSLLPHLLRGCVHPLLTSG